MSVRPANPSPRALLTLAALAGDVEWDEDDGVHHTRTCYSVETCYDAMLVAAWQGCEVDLSL